MSLAFLCPGQASQKVGMGKDIYNNTDLGKEYFAIANEIMGENIQDIIFDGPEEKLKETQFTQPAIYIVSVIIGKLLIENGAKPSCAAGHSLGEYSALTLAGSFDFRTGLSLVKIRALEMQKAGKSTKGTMAAILGLDDDIVSDICRDYAEGAVVAANYNAKGQVVISGEIESVKNTMDKMLSAGASKAIQLNVSGAFHSPLMKSAKVALSEALDDININNATFPVYSNVNAKATIQADEIRLNLKNQIDSPVLWTKTISNMKNDKVTRMVEVGPGKVLQGLTKKIDKDLQCSSIENLEQVNEFDYV